MADGPGAQAEIEQDDQRFAVTVVGDDPHARIDDIGEVDERDMLQKGVDRDQTKQDVPFAGDRHLHDLFDELFQLISDLAEGDVFQMFRFQLFERFLEKFVKTSVRGQGADFVCRQVRQDQFDQSGEFGTRVDTVFRTVLIRPGGFQLLLDFHQVTVHRCGVHLVFGFGGGADNCAAFDDRRIFARLQEFVQFFDFGDHLLRQVLVDQGADVGGDRTEHGIVTIRGVELMGDFTQTGDVDVEDMELGRAADNVLQHQVNFFKILPPVVLQEAHDRLFQLGD